MINGHTFVSLALGLHIYCKFCPLDVRSEAPETKKDKNVPKAIKTFNGRAKEFEGKKLDFSVTNAIERVPQVFPEYKYKDAYYNGRSWKNANYNSLEKVGGYDPRTVSMNNNGKSGKLDRDWPDKAVKEPQNSGGRKLLYPFC